MCKAPMIVRCKVHHTAFLDLLFTECVFGVCASFISCVSAEAALPVKVTAGSASDYSSWGVQQLMKLYYGI